MLLIEPPLASKPIAYAFVLIGDGKQVEIPAGTRVLVLGDRQPDEPKQLSAKRLVQIKVDEGPHSGLVGEAMRVQLRPIE